MEIKLDILHIWTRDNLRLQGIHYESEARYICVIFVHGMSGNFIENYFAEILGKTLAENGIGFLYGHNRGYSHINDISTKELEKTGGYKAVRIGVTYERFSECIYDIDAWLNECRRLGYKKFILMGHSLGCNKVIHYLSKEKQKDIIGIILASPPDIVGQLKMEKYQTNFKELLKEARKNIKAGQPKKILSTKIWDYYNLSSQTFLDLSEEGGAVDNLPVLRNPKEFPELASIDIRILAIMGEYDDIAIRTLEEDLDLIESKATKCPLFTKQFIKEADHNYRRQEKPLAEIVSKWIKEL